MKTLRCTSGGRLESTDPAFHSDINDRLNLNHRVLVQARKARLDRDLQQLKVRYRTATIPETSIRELIAAHTTPANGKLPELCSVLGLWARKRYGVAAW